MTKRNLTEAQLAEIADSIARSSGDRREVIAQWRRLYACSAQMVYTYARAGGWNSGRKTRSDAGSKKSAISLDAIQKAAMIKFKSTTNKYDSPMSAEDAIDVAGVGALGVKPHHVNQLLRTAGDYGIRERNSSFGLNSTGQTFNSNDTDSAADGAAGSWASET